jgi:ankyrin repeat protein
MLQPFEMSLTLPMKVANEVMRTTTEVWEILAASHDGNLQHVKELVDHCPELIYAQYNYTPPIHFAVREGHVQLVRYLLDKGALDPSYKIYPFLDPLLTIALDREYVAIAGMLQHYLNDPSLCRYKGDNGEIFYNRNESQQALEKAVDQGDLDATKRILEAHPEYVSDKTFFWGEGILMMPAKDGNINMAQLLMQYGAQVPAVSKWGRFYYFKHYDMAVYLMQNGMPANHMSWHHVTLLHDMAQSGDMQKAALLVKHGAVIDAVDEEYQSTPLGMAARWGRSDMVTWLLAKGADPNKAGAIWATPLAWAMKKGYADIEKILRNAGAQ